MNNIYKLLLPAAVLAMVLLSGCRHEDEPVGSDTNGITSFINPAEGREVSSNGETVSCVIFTEDTYVAELVLLSGEGEWVTITKGDTGVEGRNTLRLEFDVNATDAVREAELFVQVNGHEKVSVALYTQMQDQGYAELERNKALNVYMHNRLTKEYLWEEYNDLEHDLTMDYRSFLNHHLLQLGKINIEDGGTYRANSANAGKRFIYSNIQEVAPSTKAIETYGLGFGPIFSSQINQQGTVGLSIAYVHQGSPAAMAGMKRGDTIFRVNGVLLDNSNYKSYMEALYYSPSGTYEFEFVRDADINNGFKVKVSCESYVYDPVLYSAILKEGSHMIGYLVLENFDLYSHEFMIDIVQQLKDSQITDLILDLRFNPGGSVAQSRYLASAIAGTAHLDDVFVNVTFRDDKKEAWKFRGGPNDQDGLGIAPDLGLERLYVIGSENTASASELIINSLRGIDFPVYLYGSRTEGKNVGMTTTQFTHDNVKYNFSPITFRVANAKGFGDYPDGFEPEVVVNNQNKSYADDEDNTFPYSFGDWGDMDFNVALRHAYEDIIGVSSSTASMKQMSLAGFEMIPLGDTGLKQPEHGRFGNVIYLPQE